MKIDSEQLFIVTVLIIIVILFVRLLFILNSKYIYDNNIPHHTRFHDTQKPSCGTGDKYTIVKRDMKYVKM